MSYLPTGQDEPRGELIVIAQERLEIDKEQLRLAKRAALFEGIKMAVTVAVPIAAFLGLHRYLQFKKGKS